MSERRPIGQRKDNNNKPDVASLGPKIRNPSFSLKNRTRFQNLRHFSPQHF
jgi:hypothetical protein